ncbi:MAG: 3-phosphoshikimate 1-carboxyvinyltransferase, partial [Acidimicrobiia bacterium]|nr:3-phosphoshikimate 1-carboxyvinyltransferase [Acidimicrobiia bacterium]
MSNSVTAPRATFKPGGPLRGVISVPGCKGISHRALLLAALSDGRSVLRGLSLGGDVKSTLAVLEQLEIHATATATGSELTIESRGYDLFAESK